MKKIMDSINILDARGNKEHAAEKERCEQAGKLLSLSLLHTRKNEVGAYLSLIKNICPRLEELKAHHFPRYPK